MVLNATFSNISVISWQSVLLVEETEGPGENHRPVASHWQSLTLSYNVVHLALIEIRTLNYRVAVHVIGAIKYWYNIIYAYIINIYAYIVAIYAYIVVIYSYIVKIYSLIYAYFVKIYAFIIYSNSLVICVNIHNICGDTNNRNNPD